MWDNWQQCIWNEPLRYFCHFLTRTRGKYKTLKCWFGWLVLASVTGLYWFTGTGCFFFFVPSMCSHLFSHKTPLTNQTQHICKHSHWGHRHVFACPIIHHYEYINKIRWIYQLYDFLTIIATELSTILVKTYLVQRYFEFFFFFLIGGVYFCTGVSNALQRLSFWTHHKSQSYINTTRVID